MLSTIISLDSIWFGILLLYIVTGYFAFGEGLLPESVNSIALYGFLCFSVFAVTYKSKVKITGFLLWGMVCLVIGFLARFYAPSFSGTGATYYALIVNFVLVSLLTQIPWNTVRFNRVMKAFSLSAAGLILVLAITGRLQDNSESGRLGQELTGNANILGAMLLVGAIYTIWLLISSNSKRTKIVSVILLMLIYCGMFFSGGRKYIVLPIVFLYVLLAHKVDASGRSHFIRSTLIVVIVVLFVYWLINTPFFFNTIGSRFESFFNLFQEDASADGSTLIRKEMIILGWKKWLKSPIWGYGFDSFKYYNESVTGHSYYSHNNFVELLYNQGLIGFCAYYSIYVYLFIKALKMNRRSLSRGFIFAILITMLAFDIVEVTYSITPTQFMLFFAFYHLQAGCHEMDGKKTIEYPQKQIV